MKDDSDGDESTGVAVWGRGEASKNESFKLDKAPRVGDRQGSLTQSMGSQRVRHYWATKLNWTDTTDWNQYNLGPCVKNPEPGIISFLHVK